MRYPFNPSAFRWGGPFPGQFRPHGKLVFVGDRTTLALSDTLQGKAWTVRSVFAARLIVGFNVAGHAKYSMEDLVPIVSEVRMQQVGDPGASFVAQKGLYQYQTPRHRVVEEDGAQVFIINTTGASEQVFEHQMVELAEEIARRLEQETVILEIQRDGVTQVTHGITA